MWSVGLTLDGSGWIGRASVSFLMKLGRGLMGCGAMMGGGTALDVMSSAGWPRLMATSGEASCSGLVAFKRQGAVTRISDDASFDDVCSVYYPCCCSLPVCR